MIVKRDRPEAVRLAKTLSNWLRERNRIALTEPPIAAAIGAETASREEILSRAELIIVLGGDGTLLGIARSVGAREIPILGINLGGLGFLTEVPKEEATSALERVIEGDYEVDRRITLEARVEHGSHPAQSDKRQPRDNKQVEKFRAVNDVVLNKGPLGRMMQLDVIANGEPFCTYRSDGLIIATPTGSTAYALSAGGPIVFPTLDVILLAPICPHTLTNRPVVLPDSFAIEVRVRVSDHDAMVSVDGQESAQLTAEDRVIVRRGSNPVMLIRSAHPYFEIWRNKLRWG